MNFKKYFQRLPKTEKPTSKHQFHYLKQGMPTSLDWENWFYSKIFSDVLIEIDEIGIPISVDYSDCKTIQIRNFLDYHFNSYHGIPNDFLIAINRLMKISKWHESSKEVKYNNDYKKIVEKWLFEKQPVGRYCCPETEAIVESLKMKCDDKVTINAVYRFFNMQDRTYFTNYCDATGLDYDWERHKKDLFDFIELFQDYEIRKHIIEGIISEVERKGKNSKFAEAFLSFKKNILTKLQKLAILPEPDKTEESRTKQMICQILEEMDQKGWQYAFKNETDYNVFTGLLTNFFEYKEYQLPETNIQLKRNCKTKLGKAIGEIHRELSEHPLKSDTNFFEVVKVLNHFKSETDLYKVLTR